MKALFYNGKIYTLDKQKPLVEAIFVEDGLIKAVGKNDEILSLYNVSDVKKIDLKSKTMMPGFNDTHIHIWKVGDLKTFMADLRSVKSIAEMLSTLEMFSKNNSHLQWIIARGFNESMLTEKRMPTKTDLDQVFPNIPVYLIRTCAHIAVVNSKALEIAQINGATQVPWGGEMRLDENGNPNGIFTENAKGLITPFLPTYDTLNYKKMIEAASQELLSVGVTSATDPAVMPELLDVYKCLEREQKLKVRINAMPIGIPDGESECLPLPEQYQSAFLVVDTIKFFADGGLSGQTAALYKPYKNNSQNHGVLRLNYEIFYPLALKIRAQGWKIATHAIGDHAIDEVIKVYDKIQNEISFNRINRIEHLGIVTKTQMKKIKFLDIGIVTQPIFIKELGKNFMDSLDTEYLNICYPFKTMFNEGLKVAFSTDAPVVKSVNPFEGIRAAMNRKNLENDIINENECIDMMTALQAYTLGGAVAQQQDDIKGTLTVGKYADMIVIDRNIFENNESIENTQVLATYVGGELMFSKQ